MMDMPVEPPKVDSTFGGFFYFGGEMQSYRGEDLKRIRISKGIDLCTISELTKISKRHLQYIEDDNYELVPSMTYLRGYLAEYAKCIGEEPSLVVDGYLSHYMGWRGRMGSEGAPLAGMCRV